MAATEIKKGDKVLYTSPDGVQTMALVKFTRKLTIRIKGVFLGEWQSKWVSRKRCVIIPDLFKK